ncbi:hypothetical protein [Nitratifractor sp.]
MRRRTLAALIVAISFVAALLLKRYFPESRDWLMGFFLAAALSLKGALVSFYTASKLKLLAFFKGLTFLQGSLLLAKRWFLDNVFSRWLRRNVLTPLSVAFREAKEYYLGLDFRRKMRNVFMALVMAALSLWLLYWSGYLQHLFLFTELKVIVISVSKTLLLVLGKIFGVVFNSWLTPILEVFAFSWLFSWLERTLGPEHPINRFLDALGRFFGKFFAWGVILVRKYLDPLLNRRIRERTRALAREARRYIEDRKIAYELEEFERMEQILMEAHIDAYFDFKGLEEIRDKRILYGLLNRRNRSGVRIVAFVSRNEKGDLLPEEFEDDFYHDVFLLEGLASSQKRGVKREISDRPDYSDFWVLNTSLYPAELRSHSGIVPPTELDPESLRHISCDRLPDYRSGDLYLEFRGRTEAFVPVDG